MTNWKAYKLVWGCDVLFPDVVDLRLVVDIMGARISVPVRSTLLDYRYIVTYSIGKAR